MNIKVIDQMNVKRMNIKVIDQMNVKKHIKVIVK